MERRVHVMTGPIGRGTGYFVLVEMEERMVMMMMICEYDERGGEGDVCLDKTYVWTW